MMDLILSQFMQDRIGASKKGRIMLRYRIIDPVFGMINPVITSKVMAKPTPNHKNEWFRFCWRLWKKMHASARIWSNSNSTAMGMRKGLLSSLIYGLKNPWLMAVGKALRNEPAFGSSSGIDNCVLATGNDAKSFFFCTITDKTLLLLKADNISNIVAAKAQIFFLVRLDAYIPREIGSRITAI